MNDIPESAKYDNYLDKTVNNDDAYNPALDKFFEGDVEIDVPFSKKEEPTKDHVRIVKVHFKDLEAHHKFCNLVGQIIPYETTDIYYPLTTSNSLFPDADDELKNIDIDLIRPKNKIKKTKLERPNLNYWGDHWKGMPYYAMEDNDSYKWVAVKIRTEEDVNKFVDLTGCNLTDKTKFIHFPHRPKSNNMVKRWIGPAMKPKYPLYIVSKGREDTMFTSRTFAAMKIHHYIVIEPQDHDNYVEALEKFDINPYATLLVAPFSNHGDGPGRARNWAWDHSISLGAERHWVFDDNIKDFYRLNYGQRYRVMSSAIFNCMEDFVDRYTNVMIAGPNYYFFCASTQVYPPYVANTRIYSALLIKNDCKHRWRGRYNEDTDLSLRVLKDGDATVQFNAFLQGKVGTQLLKGGNTAEFYHKEGTTDKEEWRGGIMNSSGTINKSKMLYDMHPDVTTLVWKYGRAHHHVDYTGYQRRNKLILKEGIELPEKDDEYGMYFTESYGMEEND